MAMGQDPPAGWPRAGSRRVSGVVFFGVLTLLCLALTVAAIDAAEIEQLAFFGLGTLLFGHLTGMSISLIRTPRPAIGQPSVGRTDQGERGLGFSYSRAAYYWLAALLVLVAAFFVALAVAMARAGTPVGWVITAVSAAAVIFLLWFLVATLRLVPGTVVVAPTGVYHRSLMFEHFVPWSAIINVHTHGGRVPRIIVEASRSAETRERRYTGPFGAGIEGLPSMVIRTYWLGANAVPAYLALRYYFERPNERQGLASTGQTTNG